MSEDLKVSIYVGDGAGIRVQVFTCMRTLTCACVFMCMYAHTQAWCTCMCMHKAHECTCTPRCDVCGCGCPCVCTLCSLGGLRHLSEPGPGQRDSTGPLTGTINLLFSPWGWSKMKLVFHFYTMRRSVSIFSLTSDCSH